MSTHDYIVDNAVGATVRADINSALAAIATNNSSATEPATMYAYQWWADTTTGLLKQRNAANTAWLTRCVLSEGQLALLGGSASQVFSVGPATAAAHAVRADTSLTSQLSAEFTVATNALTISVNPCVVQMRSSTVTTGAPNARFLASSATMVVPDTATLGTTNGVQARLIALLIDNAGTLEAAVVNLSGGVSLDESGVISTTAISTGADAANVVYSTTARTNVPYKLVGACDITEATAGTWATSPSAVLTSSALASIGSIGFGQTRQDLTASRAVSTQYTNTTGRTIEVNIASRSNAAATITLTLGGLTLAQYQGTANGNVAFTATVLPGETYSISADAGTHALTRWLEVR